MKLTTLCLFGTLPAAAFLVHHLHAVPSAPVHDPVDALHQHLRALHGWLAPAPAPVAEPAEPDAPAPPAAEIVPEPEHPVIGYDLGRTGIEWRRGLDSVLGGPKPILLFQLLGEFDQVHC